MEVLGYIKISHPYPSFVDMEFIDSSFTQQNFGIDAMSQKPLVYRMGEWLEYDKETVRDIIARSVLMIAHLILRWLQDNEITGDVILCWQLVRDKFDIRVGCGAYKPL